MDNGFIFKRINKNINIKERKKSWRPFRIYQLISTANPALFEWNKFVLGSVLPVSLHNMILMLKYILETRCYKGVSAVQMLR